MVCGGGSDIEPCDGDIGDTVAGGCIAFWMMAAVVTKGIVFGIRAWPVASRSRSLLAHGS